MDDTLSRNTVQHSFIFWTSCINQHETFLEELKIELYIHRCKQVQVWKFESLQILKLCELYSYRLKYMFNSKFYALHF